METISAIAALLVAVTAADAQQIYRWVDEDGVVHYTDYIPTEHANAARDVLNSDGVTIRSESAALSDEQIAEQNRLRAEQAEQARTREEQRARDQVLLNTYISVQDIEDLRDRRIDLLDSQISVTDQYLTRLKTRLVELEEEASRFRDPDDSEANPELEAMPAFLAQDLAQTRSSVASYEQALSDTRSERTELEITFDADIARFKELKGID